MPIKDPNQCQIVLKIHIALSYFVRAHHKNQPSLYLFYEHHVTYKRLVDISSSVSIIFISQPYEGCRGGSRAVATSKMKRFVIIVNGWRPLTIITKRSILDVAAALDLPLGSIFGKKIVTRSGILGPLEIQYWRSNFSPSSIKE